MALSPMMQHYLSVKEKYKDCIIFYRLGDFYEMFFDDAKVASQLLELTLTGRDCGLEERAPMCGVPFHAADNYIARLVSLGQKVAICEQVEDPALAKGMVKREVIRVVTAGTLIEDEHLDATVSNYVCCAFKNAEVCALAWADITTGEFSVSEFFGSDAVKKCIAQMQKLSVSEVICNDEMLFASRDIPEVSRGVLPRFSSYLAWTFNYKSAERSLLEQFNTKTLSAFSVAGKQDAVSASGALLEYLKETQKHSLKNINGIKYVSNNGYLQLDTAAIRNLELTKTLGEGKKYGSLLWLLDKTKTAMGARLITSIILSPLGNKADIDYRLGGVDELYNSTVVRLSIADLLKEIKDIERLAGKISNGNIMPKDCLALSHSLSVIPNVKFQLSGFNSKILRDIANCLFDLTELSEIINQAINPDCTPQMMKDGGYIKEGYNALLDEYRKVKRDGGKIITQIECRERDITGIKNLRIGFNRVFGYYIEVTKSFNDKVPLHYQRRQTLANSERYITDELKEIEEKILNSEELSLKLEARLYEDIKQKLSEKIAELKIIASNIALLDVLVSFAEVSKTNKYVRPQIVNSEEPLIIKEGRHPVVEVISKERFIANDTLLDEDENRTMILTGPNMAGKSTYMRQNAVITIMAHIGCFVPARSAQIPLTDRIFTRVGASDNLIFDQSTFMVEMIEVASILQNATKNSLLILDEVGRGTSTYDGLSIAWAVIEHLTREVKAKTLFATHYHELTELESKLPGVKNYKIAVKEINGGIVFLRKIMRGGANRSFGIEVASLAGVPLEVTERAKQILKRVERGDINFAPVEEQVEQKLSEVEKILSEVDLNNLSPMQAFLLLSDLVDKVKNGKN
ncbi:MAG: DNA mismatch repair protein MutS [Clostridiales bacterium]|nr:DNA mismatch repair protein MutS [Clostridiales bacterium]